MRVTSDNWIDPPFNRWGYSHVRELTRTALVARGPRTSVGAADQNLDLDRLRRRSRRRAVHVPRDAARHLHRRLRRRARRAIVFEYYDEGIRPTDTHLLMSVSKSLTATLIGVLVGEGCWPPTGSSPATSRRSRAPSWEGCTVQHLLDMRGGVVFSEHDMDDPECDGVPAGAGVRLHDAPPAGSAGQHLRLDSRAARRSGAHGGQFVYRSILIDVLGLDRGGGHRRALRRPVLALGLESNRCRARRRPDRRLGRLPRRRRRVLRDGARPGPLRLDAPATWRRRWATGGAGGVDRPRGDSATRN